MNYVGRRVIHKLFGNGVVTSQKGDSLFIKFDCKLDSIGFNYIEGQESSFFKFVLDDIANCEKILQKLIVFMKESPDFIFSYNLLLKKITEFFPDTEINDIHILLDTIFSDKKIEMKQNVEFECFIKAKTILKIIKNKNSISESYDSLIAIVSKYIIYNGIKNISKNELSEIIQEVYSKPNDLSEFNVSKNFLRKIVSFINIVSDNIYGWTNTHIYIINDANPKKEKNEIYEQSEDALLVNYLAQYIAKEKTIEISKEELIRQISKNNFIYKEFNTDITSDILILVINKLKSKFNLDYILHENNLVYEQYYIRKEEAHKRIIEEEFKKKCTEKYIKEVINYLVCHQPAKLSLEDFLFKSKLIFSTDEMDYVEKIARNTDINQDIIKK